MDRSNIGSASTGGSSTSTGRNSLDAARSMLDAARSSASSDVSLPCDVKRPRLELFCIGSGREGAEV